MNYKYLLFSFFAIFIILNSNAQTVSPKMVFETSSHDFNKIKEDGGKVEYTFVFKNMGSEPVIINKVKSTCGCTTPDWSKEPVAPGNTGKIRVVYNPLNRPGKFYKTVTITSNAENSPVTLKISGEVLPKTVSVEETYRYQTGPVRMKKNNAHFKDIYQNETRMQKIELINTSKETVKIYFNKNRSLPKHLKITCTPESLKPNEKGIITVIYNAAEKNDWGYVYDRIYLSFNDDNSSKHRLNVSAVIKEHFTPEQIANPPVFTPISAKTYNFGTVKQGDVIEHIFTFKNTGKNDLIIRKSKASCGCTAVSLGSKIIKPGEEGSIKAVFNTRGKRGKQTKSINLTTNIPESKDGSVKSKVVLLLTGFVETPKK